MVQEYSTVKLNLDNIIIEFVEKPKKPDSTLVDTGIYLTSKTMLKLFQQYVEEGGHPDSPGCFI